ncbi:MAG: 3-oxoacyl-ACP synthase III family protein [Verrucomicrobiota bacterium]
MTNEQLVQELGRWTPEEVFAKTGIRSRCIAGPDETAVDMATKAVEQLLRDHDRSKIGFLLLCTQTGDYKLPSSSCILQTKTQLPVGCGCLDINLACSGFVYGLMVAEGLLQSGSVAEVLLVNADTYTHYIHPKDAVCRPIFGDAAVATLLTNEAPGKISGFSFGSDGSQALRMFLPAGGERLRQFRDGEGRSSVPSDPEFMRMDGPEIFNFTLRVVPQAVSDALAKAGCSMDDIDYVIFHQANAFMLEALRRKLAIPPAKFVVEMAETGNLVSASIPVVLEKMRRDARIKPGIRTLLCGFGVGLSWAACVVTW